MKEKLLEILSGIRADVDFENSKMCIRDSLFSAVRSGTFTGGKSNRNYSMCGNGSICEKWIRCNGCGSPFSACIYLSLIHI